MHNARLKIFLIYLLLGLGASPPFIHFLCLFFFLYCSDTLSDRFENQVDVTAVLVSKLKIWESIISPLTQANVAFF